VTRITTHVLDTAAGAPAAGLTVVLLAAGRDGAWGELGRAVTDADGRIGSFPQAVPGRCRLRFETGTPFFTEVAVTFKVEAGREHLHVPLLLSPYGCSVYRGS
jgi:hydroxyisourate hydrolase